MSEWKPCPFCSCTEKAHRVYSFGTDLPGGDGNVALCLRHTSDGYTLHAESIGHDKDGTDYCDNDDDVPINFCPVCGKQLNRRAQPANLAKECPAMERVECGIPYCSDKQTACDGCKPANEPLTLEQLQKGDTVWIKDLVIGEIECLRLDRIEPATYHSGDDYRFEQFGTDVGIIRRAYKYGINWLAYRHKPEGSENDG